MTEKQIIFRDYLLKRLGFTESTFVNDYVRILNEKSGLYKTLNVITEEEYSKNPKEYYYLELGIGWVPEYINILNILVWEYKNRKNKIFKIKNRNFNYISATDLANYIYCPVGLSIGSTFHVPKTLTADIGSKMHELGRLSNYLSNYNLTHFNNYIKNSSNSSFFEDIDNSELVFSGHTDDNQGRYFTNVEKRFIGQPDYIFKNLQGKLFVVEEKFMRSRFRNEKTFYNNHKIQLASYMYYLKEFNVEYGYLVYWEYSTLGHYSVDSCNVLKLYKNATIETFLASTLNEVEKIFIDRSFEVDSSKLTPSKCANCVHLLMCGHKTLRYDKVTIPYNVDNLKLFYSPYPEELKKEIADQKDTNNDIKFLPES